MLLYHAIKLSINVNKILFFLVLISFTWLWSWFLLYSSAIIVRLFNCSQKTLLQLFGYCLAFYDSRSMSFLLDFKTRIRLNVFTDFLKADTHFHHLNLDFWRTQTHVLERFALALKERWVSINCRHNSRVENYFEKLKVWAVKIASPPPPFTIFHHPFLKPKCACRNYCTLKNASAFSEIILR